MDDENFKKMILRLEEGEDIYVETPWVVDLGNDHYRMENCPFYFYGVAPGDIVTGKYSEEEQGIVFEKVIEKSGNKLIRVVFENSADKEGPEKRILEKLVNMGCSYEGANPKYICIEIPVDVDLLKVGEYLTENNVQWEHAAPTYNELYPDETDKNT